MIYKLTAIAVLITIVIVTCITSSPAKYSVEYVKNNEVYTYNISKETFITIDKRINYSLPVFLKEDSIVKDDWNHIVSVKKAEIHEDEKSAFIVILCLFLVVVILWSMLSKKNDSYEYPSDIYTM
jgi:hypothetical protein